MEGCIGDRWDRRDYYGQLQDQRQEEEEGQRREEEEGQRREEGDGEETLLQDYFGHVRFRDVDPDPD
jgi:hypothetical protein